MSWFYWTGVVAWTIVGIKVIHFLLETLAVTTRGWDEIDEFGIRGTLWRLIRHGRRRST